MEMNQSQREQFYLTQARELGLQFGDSPELSQLCRAAYEDYGHLHWLILDHCIQHCKKSPPMSGMLLCHRVPNRPEELGGKPWKKIFQMELKKVYSLLVAKARTERPNRAEVDELAKGKKLEKVLRK